MQLIRPYIDYHDIYESYRLGFVSSKDCDSIISQLNGIYNEYSIHRSITKGSDKSLSGNA